MTEYPIPVRVRTARTEHACNDCDQPISPGEKYELLTVPPHRMPEYDVPRWLRWRTHHPRHDGAVFLIGCAMSAAYREHADRINRAATAAGLEGKAT